MSLWGSVGSALIVLLIAASGVYLGDCSYETGYMPQVGLMWFVPGLLLAVGAVEAAVAAAIRGNNPVGRYVVGGLAVCALSVMSYVFILDNVGDHLCD